MPRTRRLLCVAFTLLGTAASPQGNPLGPEFRVNTYTTSTQVISSVAVDSSGRFVVVWASYGQDGSSDGVFGQRYDSSGLPLGAEFGVNTYTQGQQIWASVATDSLGAFVVVWQSPQDGSGTGIFGQRFASSGVPSGIEFRVNAITTGAQYRPVVAAEPSGSFVVVWMSPQGPQYNISGQRYASSGAPLGPEFRVNTYDTAQQTDPSVAADSAGNFVVVWESGGQDGSGFGVFAQRYASSGVPLGPEFRVNTYTTGSQRRPDVAAGGSGDFVVVWASPQDGSGFGVFGRRYSSGAPVGPEFRVNSFTTGYQYLPEVAADASGNFVVTWASYLQDGSANGIFGQRYASTGQPLGPEFRVNSYTTASQYRPSVAANPTGRFVVTWESQSQDGSLGGVFGQRYGEIVPVELMHVGVE